MVLSETKSASVIKISQRYCLLTVWNSDLFSICSFGRLDFFFQATWLRARWLSGDLTVNHYTEDSNLLLVVVWTFLFPTETGKINCRDRHTVTRSLWRFVYHEFLIAQTSLYQEIKWKGVHKILGFWVNPIHGGAQKSIGNFFFSVFRHSNLCSSIVLPTFRHVIWCCLDNRTDHTHYCGHQW